VFVVVSEKERYPTGSTFHTIPQSDKTTNVWNINYTNHNPSAATNIQLARISPPFTEPRAHSAHKIPPLFRILGHAARK
jgi:hypothetical protein